VAGSDDDLDLVLLRCSRCGAVVACGIAGPRSHFAVDLDGYLVNDAAELVCRSCGSRGYDPEDDLVTVH
jgi:hypothetical protein